MEIHHRKVLGQSPKDIELTPLLRVDASQMDFHYYLVDPLKHLDWKILEGLVFPTLDVYFKAPVLASQVMSLYHVFQGHKHFSIGFFSPLSHTGVVEGGESCV